MKQVNKVNNLKISNNLFANYLDSNGLVLPKDVMLEVTRDIANSVLVADCFKNYSKIITTPGYHHPSLLFKQDDILTSKNTPNFVCNGVYSKAFLCMNEILDNGAFNVGVCTMDDDSYNAGKRFYKQLHETLLANGVPVIEMEDTISSNKIYLLSYRSNGGSK